MLEPRIGVDESGKGDFFGPLVVAGVYVNESAARDMMEIGVRDSKLIKSDARIAAIAKQIRGTPGCVCNVVAHRPGEVQPVAREDAQCQRYPGLGPCPGD